MDSAQLLLLIVVVILTGLLLVLGFQVYFILQEFRRTIKKANKVLDDIDLLTQSIATPISKLSTLTSGLKTGAVVATALKILPFFQSKRRDKRDDE